MIIKKNVCSGQNASHLLRIQIGYTAIYIGKRFLPKKLTGLEFGFFAPHHNSNIGYSKKAFYGNFLPGLYKPVGRWNKVYKFFWKILSFKFHI